VTTCAKIIFSSDLEKGISVLFFIALLEINLFSLCLLFLPFYFIHCSCALRTMQALKCGGVVGFASLSFWAIQKKKICFGGLKV